jgi:hypothetical protein
VRSIFGVVDIAPSSYAGAAVYAAEGGAGDAEGSGAVEATAGDDDVLFQSRPGMRGHAQGGDRAQLEDVLVSDRMQLEQEAQAILRAAGVMGGEGGEGVEAGSTSEGDGESKMATAATGTIAGDDDRWAAPRAPRGEERGAEGEDAAAAAAAAAAFVAANPFTSKAEARAYSGTRDVLLGRKFAHMERQGSNADGGLGGGAALLLMQGEEGAADSVGGGRDQGLLRPDPIMVMEACIGFSGKQTGDVLWTADGKHVVFASNSTVVIMEAPSTEGATHHEQQQQQQQQQQGGDGPLPGGRSMSAGDSSAGGLSFADPTLGTASGASQLTGLAPPSSSSASSSSAQKQTFLHGHTGPVSQLALNREGTLLATAQAGKFPMIRVWHVEKRECAAILTAHDSGMCR